MKVKRAINPIAVKEREDYIVIGQLEDETPRIVESAFTKERAEKAVKILTEHDHKNGRLTKYFYRLVNEIEVI